MEINGFLANILCGSQQKLMTIFRILNDSGEKNFGNFVKDRWDWDYFGTLVFCAPVSTFE